tara:strand:- start:11119 stop:11859 length:741 start_codon:yes stop_codon:yes gene_type:complete
MADIFLSYKGTDYEKVREIIQLLGSQQNWSIWWDRDIEKGELWSARIRKELRDAKCVVVAWSIRSIDPISGKWVLAEADYGFNKNRLIGVRIEPVGIPVPFNQIQSIDLFGDKAAGRRALIKAVGEKLAKRSPGKQKKGQLRWKELVLECKALGVGFSITKNTLRGRQSLLIGRDKSCDLWVPYDAVSREHARITFDKYKGPCIIDLGSANGTYLDRGKVGKSRRPLLRARHLELGTLTFTVEVIN